ncbi:hypothetical protein BDA96_03G152400 [Sorghum bicolor]|jgi:hypothetical protein|uniref:DUF4228 domain-containing protein n=2 Tax=Sorghum bicolor TaxID=4558 RepID=A0A921RCY6_SORBI|nr:uncharacterized protein LOC8060327 [Sorghum bicolor]EES00638.1 hypothetical protein SORBI_3003G144800 [Sorghum bicolor]KAG0537484.1 hypothetical protein BDA96_03G152400 [Sorghum bicolor]|eukprot:XP_002455518.1 uncharacterized protein LOC8060327 [Sorghum bicolor]
MGNLVSQCVANGAGGARRPVVVGPDGSRTTVEENTGVAELMIDAPGHVVARATDVASERRVRAMAADEFLRAGMVYLLVPAGRAGARLGDREVEAIGRLVSGKKSSRKSRRHAGGKRVFPADVNGEEMENAAQEKEVVCAGKRAHDHGFGPRQWRPALDTIYEA